MFYWVVFIYFCQQAHLTLHAQCVISFPSEAKNLGPGDFPLISLPILYILLFLFLYIFSSLNFFFSSQHMTTWSSPSPCAHLYPSGTMSAAMQNISQHVCSHMSFFNHGFFILREFCSHSSQIKLLSFTWKNIQCVHCCHFLSWSNPHTENNLGPKKTLSLSPLPHCISLLCLQKQFKLWLNIWHTFLYLSRLPYATLKTHKDGDCQAFVKTPTNC